MSLIMAGQISDLQKRLKAAEAENERLRVALREIMKGEGRFSRLPIEHAKNTIEDMKQLARDALGEPTD